jgi:hypothetical protein
MDRYRQGTISSEIHSLGVLQAQHLSFKNGPAAEEWNFWRQLPEESVEQ